MDDKKTEAKFDNAPAMKGEPELPPEDEEKQPQPVYLMMDVDTFFDSCY